jgi:hypothetical protein
MSDSVNVHPMKVLFRHSVPVSLTPRFSGVGVTGGYGENRFSGFSHRPAIGNVPKTAEAVTRSRDTDPTPLKRGVNETGRCCGRNLDEAAMAELATTLL